MRWTLEAGFLARSSVYFEQRGDMTVEAFGGAARTASMDMLFRVATACCASVLLTAPILVGRRVLRWGWCGSLDDLLPGQK